MLIQYKNATAGSFTWSMPPRISALIESLPPAAKEQVEHQVQQSLACYIYALAGVLQSGEMTTQCLRNLLDGVADAVLKNKALLGG